MAAAAGGGGGALGGSTLGSLDTEWVGELPLAADEGGAICARRGVRAG